jgi:hypothetical protein
MLKPFWKWLGDHTNALQGLGAVVTAAAALAALVIIPLQISAAEQIQLRQTARDMYRGFVQLTLERPALANADYCALKTPEEVTAYESYIEFLLYTAEHNLRVAEGDWRGPLLATMRDHLPFFCAFEEWDFHSPEVVSLIAEIQTLCPATPACTAADGP